MKIKSIVRNKYKEKKDFYCLNVTDHTLVIKGKDKKGNKTPNDHYQKNCGFGFLFGMSASMFASSTLRMDWTPKRCEDFIKEMKLQKLKKDTELKYKVAGDSLSYLTVATFFRNGFFESYPTLEKWILKQGEIATEQGYIQSPWGAIRLLPQLLYKGKDTQGKVTKNLTNISVNSPVQDYETVYMAKAMIEADRVLEEKGFSSYVVGTVHDSIVAYAHIPEQEKVLKTLLEPFTYDYPQARGVSYSGECNVADVAKGELWGYGHREVKLKDVEDVVV